MALSGKYGKVDIPKVGADEPVFILPARSEIVEQVFLHKIHLETVPNGILFRQSDTLCGNFHGRDRCRPGPRAMQCEGSLVAKTIEHVSALGKTRHFCVLFPLIEVKARFLALLQVEKIFHALNGKPSGRQIVAVGCFHFQRKPLVLTGRGIVAEQYRFGL